jgi:excisionase family DNA binding protein
MNGYKGKEHSMNTRIPLRNPSREELQPLAYSIAQATYVSSIGRTRIYSLIKEGKLQACKIGKRTLIPAASLRALIEGEG